MMFGEVKLEHKQQFRRWVMKIIISSGIDGPSEIKNLEQIAVRQSKKNIFPFVKPILSSIWFV